MAFPVGTTEDVSEATLAAADVGRPVSEGDHDGEVVIDRTVMEVQKFLAEIYLEAEIAIGGAAMVEGMSASVQHLQINLVMISRVDLHSEFKNQGFDSSGDMWRAEHSLTAAAECREKVTLESLFESTPSIVSSQCASYRVFALASGGCGKTTIFTKIATWKWARKELWPQFDILIALEMRHSDVREAKSLWDLLESSGLDEPLSKKDRSAIRLHFKAHPQRLCIVFDGLDETELVKCSGFVQRVINGEELKGIRMIITGRPCPDILSLCARKPHDGRIEVIGFRRDDVERYVLNVLGSSKGEELMAEVKKDEHLLAMMCTPIIAREVCVLYHYRPQQIPRCLSDMFNLMILHLAGRRHEAQFDNWEEIPVETRQQILELGRFAFRMLQEQRLVFTEADLETVLMSKEAKLLGLLIAADRSPSIREKQWRFSHLTFQENLSVKFVVSCADISPKYVVHLVESLGPQSGHFRTFWILLAAQLNFACLETLVNSLVTRRKKTIHCIVTAAMTETEPKPTQCVQFPLNVVDFLCENLNRDQMDRLADRLLCDVVHDSAANYIENKMKRCGPVTHELFLKTLLLQWLEVVPQASGAMLVKTLRSLNIDVARRCQDLLQSVLSEPAAEKPISLQLPWLPSVGSTHLPFLCYAEHARHHGDDCPPLPTISYLLGAICWTLSVADDPFLHRAIDSVIKHHPSSIANMKLHDFEFGSDRQVPQSVADCDQLKTITTAGCDCQWKVITQAILKSALTLTGINCSYSTLGTGDISSFASALKCCRKLHRINIDAECTTVASAILASVSSHSSLCKIEITARSQSPQHDEPLVIPDLRKCQALESLALSGCHLSGSSLRDLADAVQHLPKLSKRPSMVDSCWVSASVDECREFERKVGLQDRLLHPGRAQV